MSIKLFGRYFVAVLLVVSITVPGANSASLFDVLPGVSQVKSLFQLMTGDVDGAKNTQLNFLNEGLGTSQARSVYFLVTGDPGKALDVQKDFVGNLEPVVDGLPLIGHLKSGIHLILGDYEHGLEAMISATSSMGALTGALIAGPVGAIAGQAITDTTITILDQTIRGNKAKPHGIMSVITNLPNKTSGEVFDTVGVLGLSGVVSAKVKPLYKPFYKPSTNKGTYQMMPQMSSSPIRSGVLETAV